MSKNKKLCKKTNRVEEVAAVHRMGTILKNCSPEEREIFEVLRKPDVVSTQDAPPSLPVGGRQPARATPEPARANVHENDPPEKKLADCENALGIAQDSLLRKPAQSGEFKKFLEDELNFAESLDNPSKTEPIKRIVGKYLSTHSPLTAEGAGSVGSSNRTAPSAQSFTFSEKDVSKLARYFYDNLVSGEEGDAYRKFMGNADIKKDMEEKVREGLQLCCSLKSEEYLLSGAAKQQEKLIRAGIKAGLPKPSSVFSSAPKPNCGSFC